ncbi:MAG TPA: right-handed parallel beta-helix repeat-containing protein [Candidatus Binatia bacterium]|nr:right-handed parallel beta-helix repeat-containing protein [Candidatus Binatia bacterium]
MHRTGSRSLGRTLVDSTASGNGMHGVIASSAAALHNVVAEHNVDDGIVVYADGKSAVANCTANYNGRFGIRVGSGDSRVRLTRNTANGNEASGILLEAGVVRARRNLTDGNAVAGIRLQSAAGKLLSNVATGNDHIDMYDGTGCRLARWRGNVFDVASPCID